MMAAVLVARGRNSTRSFKWWGIDLEVQAKLRVHFRSAIDNSTWATIPQQKRTCNIANYTANNSSTLLCHWLLPWEVAALHSISMSSVSRCISSALPAIAMKVKDNITLPTDPEDICKVKAEPANTENISPPCLQSIIWLKSTIYPKPIVWIFLWKPCMRIIWKSYDYRAKRIQWIVQFFLWKRPQLLVLWCCANFFTYSNPYP